MSQGFAPELVQSSIVSALHSSFSSVSRLYDLSIEGIQIAAPAPATLRGAHLVIASGFLPGQTFMVEAYTGIERLNTTLS